MNESNESLLRWIPLLPLLAAALHGVMIGVVRRPLATDPDILVATNAGLDGHAHDRFDGVVAFVEQVGDDTRVSVQSKGQLCHVVGPDRHPVEVIEVLIGQQRIRR